MRESEKKRPGRMKFLFVRVQIISFLAARRKSQPAGVKRFKIARVNLFFHLRGVTTARTNPACIIRRMGKTRLGSLPKTVRSVPAARDLAQDRGPSSLCHFLELASQHPPFRMRWAKWSYLPRKNEMQRGHNPNWLLRWPPLLCALLHQQFVGENAQAIDCSCLDP